MGVVKLKLKIRPSQLILFQTGPPPNKYSCSKVDKYSPNIEHVNLWIVLEPVSGFQISQHLGSISAFFEERCGDGESGSLADAAVHGRTAELRSLKRISESSSGSRCGRALSPPSREGQLRLGQRTRSSEHRAAPPRGGGQERARACRSRIWTGRSSS